MLEEDEFILIKSRTYTDNETSMVRTQLDTQFGNSDGYLDQSEVDAFVASYDNYFEQTNYVIVEEILVVKQNATVNYTNLVGGTSDNASVITTTFTFEASVPHLFEEYEHYIKFNKELWKYVDIDGIAQYTVDNNLTFSSPDGFKIVYTRGLLNQSYSSGNKTLLANPNMQFDWVTIKISKGIFDEDPVDTDPEDDSNPLFLILIFMIPIIIIGVVLVIVIKGRKRASDMESVDEPSPGLSDEEIAELELVKKTIKEEIIKVRADLRMDVISKDSAKSKESALKGKFKEIQKKLDMDRISSGK